MTSTAINRLHPAIAAGLLILALAFASGPAKAHHGADFVAPLAAFIAFGALVHHSQQNHYHHGHHGHGHRPHYRPYRRHSHSRGGYYGGHQKHHRNW